MSKRWIISGVIMGVVGGLLIILGIVWVFRDIAQTWARGGDGEEGSLIM
jgi:uncharacterized membrane protein